MSTPTPVTQRDVARACGVHPSTICLALNNAPSIPLETRRRIQAVAARLGYTPNVGARNLALMRTEKKASGSLPLIWLNQEPRRDHWKANADARVQLDAARREAEEWGYHLEELWAREPGMTAARLVQIIRTRGISGVLFPIHRSFDFSLLSSAWGEFSTVGLNDRRLGEWIDVVCADYHANADALRRGLRRADGSRVGLVLSTQFDASSHGLVHGGFLRYQAELPARERLPVCFVSDDTEAKTAAFAEWYREQRPDLVIARDPALAVWAGAEGFDCEWAQLNTASSEASFTLDESPGDIAAAAVKFLVDKVRRFETGIAGSTRTLTIKGTLTERAVAPVARETESVVA
jgi:LacI family transcriptional regulator